MVRILTVMDNMVSGNRGLISCHGLSFYIETGKIKILFDFGSGRETWENARRLNVPLAQISYLVFSHSHYDHCAGFLWGKEYEVQGKIVHGEEKAFFQEKYRREKGKFTYLGSGLNREYLSADSWQQLVCEDILKLGEGCWAVGQFKWIHPQETISQQYVREGKEKMEADPFEEEICLVLEARKGLIVVTGCSHPGIINMLDTVAERFRQPIWAVAGGLHLAKAGLDRMEWTAQQLRRLGVCRIAFNHCTGTAFAQVLERQGMEYCYLGAGDCLYDWE